MKKVKIGLFILCYCYTYYGLSQSINDYYKFKFSKEKDTSENYVQYDQLRIYKKYFPKDYSYPPRKVYNVEDNFMYFSINDRKTDSAEFEKNSSIPNHYEIINIDDKLYFQFQKFLYEIDKAKGKIRSKYPLRDSIKSFSGKYEDYFLYTTYKEDKYYRLYSFHPETRTSKLLYDFTGKIDRYYSIDDFIYLKGKNKLLVMAIFAEPSIEDVVYFILDLKTLKVENVTNTNFAKLVEAPRKKFESSPYYQRTIHCDPVYEYYYYDSTDTLVYIKVDDYYGYVENEKSKAKSFPQNSLSIIYPQDAFVLNPDYEIIDQVLNRERVLEYFSDAVVYENGKKKWVMLYGQTDSASCYFNIAIKYPLEKAFYNIYYNKELTVKELESFDQYELLLLKNFIYAKYNYKFSNPFYEAYYNTFTFYHDFQTWDSAKKKIPRRKKVDKYFTASDKANLKLILTKIK